MKKKVHMIDGITTKEYFAKLEAIKSDLRRRFGGNFRKSTTVIRFDYYESMGVVKEDLQILQNKPDLKNRELTYENLLMILSHKRKRIVNKEKKKDKKRRRQACYNPNHKPKEISAFEMQRRQRQREWSLRLSETKERIRKELGFDNIKYCAIPVKYYYEYGMTDEDILAMRNHPKFKDDTSLTWQNLLWAVGIKKREQRGLVKKRRKVLLCKVRV